MAAVRGKSGEFHKNLVEEAKNQGLTLVDQKQIIDEANAAEETNDKQQSLPGVPRPSTVVGNMMLAEFVRPHFYMDDSARFCGLEFSFPLTKDHRNKLYKSVETAWKFLDKRGYKGVNGIEIPEHRITIKSAPDTPDVALLLPYATIDKAVISFVKEIGKGASEKVVRFSFHAIADAENEEVYRFACLRFGQPFWIEMEPAQREMEE